MYMSQGGYCGHRYHTRTPSAIKQTLFHAELPECNVERLAAKYSLDEGSVLPADGLHDDCTVVLSPAEFISTICRLWTDTTYAQLLGADPKEVRRKVRQWIDTSEDEVISKYALLVGCVQQKVLRTQITLGELKHMVQAMNAIPEAEARFAKIMPDYLALIEAEKKACAACWQSNTHRDTSDVSQQGMKYSAAEQARLRVCAMRMAAYMLCRDGFVKVTYCTRAKQAPCTPLPDAWHADWVSVINAVGKDLLAAAEQGNHSAVLPKMLTVEVLNCANAAE